MRIIKVFCCLVITSISVQSQTRIDSIDYTFGGGVTGVQSITRFNKDIISSARGLIIESFAAYKKMKRLNWKAIVKHASSLIDENIEYFHPGNIYYSITIYYGGTKKNICWRTDDQNIPTSVRSLNSVLKKIQ